jgi:HSP20 family protein
MSTDLEKREKKAVNHTAAEQIDQSGPSFSPDVDIYASDDTLIMAVDLPGVKKGDVTINLDENNALVLKAKNTFTEPEGAVMKQYNIGDYYRAFQISDDYDKEKISPTLENGLLEITIPKREEVKPKKIEIKA